MIKNPQTQLRVYIWEYSAAGTECSSYVNVGRSVEWQTIQVSHIIQSSDANRISLRVTVLNSGTIYFKQMRLTSSS